MNKQVNFEDNIFILANRIKMVKDIFSLEADPDLFLEKTLDEVDFITQALTILLQQLQENRRFIERFELFHYFEDLEWQFSQVLSGFMNNQGTMSIRDYPAIVEKINILRSRSQERRRAAETAGGASASQAGEPVVSSDELSELLKEY
jgi:hypothetical protein